MRRIAIIATTIALTSCGTDYQRNAACREQAGRQPDQAAAMFGIAGAAIMLTDPAFQIWAHRVDACMARTARSD